ncbi:MAG: hypothetical protein V1755_06535 [Chloroflexota bacterium]
MTTEDLADLEDARDDATHLAGWHSLMADTSPRGSAANREHKRLARRYSAQADDIRDRIEHEMSYDLAEVTA